MAVNVEIDDVILTNQPSRIELIPAAALRTQATGGGFIGATRNEGDRIRITWGVDVAITAVMAELRTARGGTVAHKLEFDDPSSVHYTIEILWLADPSFTIMLPELYRNFTIEFLERSA